METKQCGPRVGTGFLYSESYGQMVAGILTNRTGTEKETEFETPTLRQNLQEGLSKP